jgi:hypothetical protein
MNESKRSNEVSEWTWKDITIVEPIRTNSIRLYCEVVLEPNCRGDHRESLLCLTCLYLQLVSHIR